MKITRVEDLRIANRRQILKEIRRCGQISRAELSKTLGINKGTVSTIVKELQDEHYVTEVSVGDSASGRKPILLSLVNQNSCAVAVYIQINRAKIIVADLRENVLSSREIPIKPHQEFQDFYNTLVQVLDEIRRDFNDRELTGISFISIGSVDLEGNIRLIPDLNWRNIDFCSMLGPRFHVPVHVISVGNLMVSYIKDKNPQYRDVVVLSVDDTVTSGTMVNGQMMKGFLGFASTLAHHVINKNETAICSCGKKGCFSQYCTNGALLTRYNLAAPTPRGTIEGFIETCKQNDPVAKAILQEYICDMAVALANIIYIINPEVIILTGTVLGELPQLLHEIYQRIVLPVTYQSIILMSMQDLELMKSAANLGFDCYLDTK